MALAIWPAIAVSKPQPAVQVTERAAHLPALTGLRFCVALWVLLFHALVFFHIAPHGLVLPGLLASILGTGSAGVTFFFILSGFILAHTYLDATGALRIPRRAFYVARLARIYPAYLLGLALGAVPFFVWAWGTHGAPLLAVFGTLSLTQSWFAEPPFLAWNSPGWSVSAEAFFYLLFPFAALTLARLSPRGLRLALGALFIMTFAIPLVYLVIHPDGVAWEWESPWLRVVAFGPLARLPEFLIGVVLGRLLVVTPPRSLSPIVREILPLLVILLGALAFDLRTWWSALEQHNGLLAPLFAVLVVLAASGTPGRLLSLAAHPVMVRLGEISFGLYMVEWPLLQWLDHLWPNAHGWGVCAAYIATALAVAYASYRFIEAPARRAIRRTLMIGA